MNEDYPIKRKEVDMYSIELEQAKKAAREAGELLLKREAIQVDSDEKKDIKISSDKESERIIIDSLSIFGYSLLSEEFGFIDKGTELWWIVDPLDGTMNYVKGMDELTCISIALWKNDDPILGVVYRYKNDEMFYGVVEEGAYLNDHMITSSSVKYISKAVLGTGFPVRRNYSDEALKKFFKNAQIFKKVRMLGAAAIMATYVACGRLDVYMEENVMLWDIAAAVAIVKAAGGVVKLKRLSDYKAICECYGNENLLYED